MGGVHPVGWERTSPTPSASCFWFVGSPWLSHLLIFCLHLHMYLCACLSMSGLHHRPSVHACFMSDLHHCPSVQDYFMCPSLVGTATSEWRPCQSIQHDRNLILLLFRQSVSKQNCILRFWEDRNIENVHLAQSTGPLTDRERTKGWVIVSGPWLEVQVRQMEHIRIQNCTFYNMAHTFHYFFSVCTEMGNPFRSWEHLEQHAGLKGLGVTVTIVRIFDKDTHQDVNSIIF